MVRLSSLKKKKKSQIDGGIRVDLFFVHFFLCSDPFPCPRCKVPVAVSECFSDKAAMKDFNSSEVSCKNLGCYWKGAGRNYTVSCSLKKISSC